MNLLFGDYIKWKEFAIDLLCSNENCKSELIIDSRKVTGLIFCSGKCSNKFIEDLQKEKEIEEKQIPAIVRETWLSYKKGAELNG